MVNKWVMAYGPTVRARAMGPRMGLVKMRAGSGAGGQRAGEAARTDVVEDQLLQHGAPPLVESRWQNTVAHAVARCPTIYAWPSAGAPKF